MGISQSASKSIGIFVHCHLLRSIKMILEYSVCGKDNNVLLMRTDMLKMIRKTVTQPQGLYKIIDAISGAE